RPQREPGRRGRLLVSRRDAKPERRIEAARDPLADDRDAPGSVVEVCSQSDVDLDVAGLDGHGTATELLGHIEGLREARATLNEPVPKVEVRACVQVVTEHGTVFRVQILPNLLLAIGIVGDHNVSADAIVDERHMGTDVRPEESVPLWADFGTDVQTEVTLV